MCINSAITIIMTTLSILTWNVRGVMSSSLCLTKLLNEKNIDIALISEHKLFSYNRSFMDSLDNNYNTLIKCDSSLDQYDLLKCGKAGVAIMYHKMLSNYEGCSISNGKNAVTFILIKENH